MNSVCFRVTLQHHKEPCPARRATSLGGSPHWPHVSAGPGCTDHDWHGQDLAQGSHEEEIRRVDVVRLDEVGDGGGGDGRDQGQDDS